MAEDVYVRLIELLEAELPYVGAKMDVHRWKAIMKATKLARAELERKANGERGHLGSERG